MLSSSGILPTTAENFTAEHHGYQVSILCVISHYRGWPTAVLLQHTRPFAKRNSPPGQGRGTCDESRREALERVSRELKTRDLAHSCSAAAEKCKNA